MAWPVQLALVEKRVEHRSVMLDFSKGDNRSERFLGLNPRGKVPVLEHGDLALYEARAILEYLEAQFPDPALIPASPRERATDLIRKHETSYIYPAADPAISYTSYASTLTREEWDPAELARLRKPLVAEFARWDGYLEGRDWLAGGAGPTQSDLLLIPLIMYMRRFGFDYAAYGFPNLDRYFRRCEQRESVASTWPPHWKETEGDPTFAV